MIQLIILYSTVFLVAFVFGFKLRSALMEKSDLEIKSLRTPKFNKAGKLVVEEKILIKVPWREKQYTIKRTFNPKTPKHVK